MGAEADLKVASVIGWRLAIPSRSIGYAMRVEDEVELLGKQEDYIDNLQDIVKQKGDNAKMTKWRIAHAKPIDRCKAYLLMYAIE